MGSKPPPFQLTRRLMLMLRRSSQGFKLNEKRRTYLFSVI